MVPGTGYTCGVITPTTPCKINGVVNQENNTYTEDGFGFFEPPGIQYDPRLGLAWSVNSRTVVRAGAGQFHEGSGGFYVTGGPAFRFDRVVRFTDFNSFFTGTGTTTPTNVTGTTKEDKRTATYRYTLGVQRDLGWHTLLDVAYVGDQTHFLPVQRNYNQIAAGAQFLPENRDATVTATAANPPAAETGNLESKLDRMLDAPGGLTSNVVATRAEEVASLEERVAREKLGRTVRVVRWSKRTPRRSSSCLITCVAVERGISRSRAP